MHGTCVKNQHHGSWAIPIIFLFISRHVLLWFGTRANQFCVRVKRFCQKLNTTEVSDVLGRGCVLSNQDPKSSRMSFVFWLLVFNSFFGFATSKKPLSKLDHHLSNNIQQQIWNKTADFPPCRSMVWLRISALVVGLAWAAPRVLLSRPRATAGGYPSCVAWVISIYDTI